MRSRKVVLLPELADVVRRLPPATKRKVRATIAALRSEPDLGEPLERELSGLRRISIGQHRVVYRSVGGGIEIVAIGPRRSIYVDLERAARREVR